MLPSFPFYMIRHGQTEANLAGVSAGRGVDTPLTPLGRTQAEAAQVIVASLSVRPSRIVHSTLSRARETAVLLNKPFGLPATEDADLCEQGVGDFEGGDFDEFRKCIQEGKDPPNGERTVDFRYRVQRGIGKAISMEPGPVLLVTHGGVFRAFGDIYGVSFHGVGNCQFYEFCPDPELDRIPWAVWHYDPTPDGVVRRRMDFHPIENVLLKTAG